MWVSEVFSRRESNEIERYNSPMNDQFTRGSRPVRYLTCGAPPCAPSARLHLTPKTLFANRASNVRSPPLRKRQGKRHETRREKSQLISASQRTRAVAVASQKSVTPQADISPSSIHAGNMLRAQHAARAACHACSMPRAQRATQARREACDKAAAYSEAHSRAQAD